MSYLKQHGQAPAPQSEPLRPDQVENSAGGYAWQADSWQRLRRFLVLGSEGGSYYAGERELTRANVDNLRAALAEDGQRFLDEVVGCSRQGRAPKNDPAIFALALACAAEEEEVRKQALRSLPLVCRTGTHLFQFAEFVEGFRGWGKGLQRAVLRWYDEKPADKLALQLVKYRQRGGRSR